MKRWMVQNRLKMNDDNREFIIYWGRWAVQKRSTNAIRVGGIPIPVWNSWAWPGIDTYLSRATSLWSPRLLYLPCSIYKRSGWISPKRTIWNWLLLCMFVGMPKETLSTYPKFAAKVSLGRSKFSRSTDPLREFDILPVSLRFEYKIMLMVFKCLHALAPSYLNELLSGTRCSYNTRAAAKNLLVIPLTHKDICWQVAQCCRT